MSNARLIWVTEVHNFGGFFGGDTVTLSATPWPEGAEETLTIDEKALDNVTNRHMIAPEMLLELKLAGERVDHARLIGARDLETLHAAVSAAPSAPKLEAPRVRAYRCQSCDLWIVGQPTTASTALCTICGQPLD